jgi:hypothetical protein
VASRRAFAVKAEVADPRADTFSFGEQKTMYGGKTISDGGRGNLAGARLSGSASGAFVGRSS